MNENAIHPVQWAHNLRQRAEAQQNFVLPTAILVFVDPPLGIRQAGFYSLVNPLN